MDWAMKFLPQMYREKMTDWFGQKGMHWHVTVCIYLDQDGQLKHKTYTHLLDQVKQDNFAVISLLEHALLTVKKQLPDIEEAFLRSDNAGCYHCGHIWFSLNGVSERTGINIIRYDYSETQSGKSYCDAKIAHMRGKMRIYATEGHNIQTCCEMKDAIDSNGGVCGVQTAVVDIDTSKQKLITHSLKGVTKFSNLAFTAEGIRVWQAYCIGEGYLIKPDEIKKFCRQEQNETGAVILRDFDNCQETSGTIKRKEKAEDNEVHGGIDHHGNEPENGEESNPEAFYCPENGCVKSYQSFRHLQEHLTLGKHEYKLQTESSFDLVKKLWASKCEQISNRSRMLAEPNLEVNETCEPIGWALKRERKTVRFSQHVKTYLTDVFRKGAETGKKVNSATVAIEMRTLCEGGQRKFSPNEWLQQSQISSFFSRLSLNNRQGKTKKTLNDNCDDHELQAVLNLLENEEVLENIEIINSA